MEISKICLTIFAILSISGCGVFKNSNDPTLRTLASSVNTIFMLKNSKQNPPNVRKILNEEFLENLDQPALFAEMNSEKAALLTKFPGNNRFETWIAPDGVTFAFDGNNLKGTRGLGFDLMSSVGSIDLARVNENVEYLRTMTWLISDNQLMSETFQCRSINSTDNPLLPVIDFAQGSRTVREICKSNESRFENIFVIGPSGRTNHSYQYISPELGSIYLEFL